MRILNKNNSAFTLIELLVVIAIIGILSSVVLASLSGARESAKVTKMVSDLQQIETGLVMWMDAKGNVQWVDEDSFSLGSNPSIKEIINNSDVSNYLTSAPEPPFGDNYSYDNDSPSSQPGKCGGPDLSIFVRNVDTNKIDDIDKIIDGEVDGNCGKVRKGGGGTLIYYVLSFTGNL